MKQSNFKLLFVAVMLLAMAASEKALYCRLTPVKILNKQTDY